MKPLSSMSAAKRILLGISLLCATVCCLQESVRAQAQVNASDFHQQCMQVIEQLKIKIDRKGEFTSAVWEDVANRLESAKPSDPGGVELLQAAKAFAGGHISAHLMVLAMGETKAAAPTPLPAPAPAGVVAPKPQPSQQSDPGKRSFKENLTLSENGDAEAMEYLGEQYELGDGTTKNLTEAIKWYVKSAEAGRTWPMVRIGKVFLEDEDPLNDSAALMWLGRATDDQGEIDCQGFLIRGAYYASREQWAMAFENYVQADKERDKRGYVAECRLHAAMLIDAKLVPSNDPTTDTLKWLEKCYADTDGGEHRLGAARMASQLDAASDDVKARWNLRVAQWKLTDRSSENAKDLKKQAEDRLCWDVRHLRGADPEVQKGIIDYLENEYVREFGDNPRWAVGMAYEDGIYVGQDRAKAIRYYTESAWHWYSQYRLFTLGVPRPEVLRESTTGVYAALDDLKKGEFSLGYIELGSYLKTLDPVMSETIFQRVEKECKDPEMLWILSKVFYNGVDYDFIFAPDKPGGTELNVKVTRDEREVPDRVIRIYEKIASMPPPLDILDYPSIIRVALQLIKTRTFGPQLATLKGSQVSDLAGRFARDANNWVEITGDEIAGYKGVCVLAGTRYDLSASETINALVTRSQGGWAETAIEAKLKSAGVQVRTMRLGVFKDTLEILPQDEEGNTQWKADPIIMQRR